MDNSGSVHDQVNNALTDQIKDQISDCGGVSTGCVADYSIEGPLTQEQADAYNENLSEYNAGLAGAGLALTGAGAISKNPVVTAGAVVVGGLSYHSAVSVTPVQPGDYLVTVVTYQSGVFSGSLYLGDNGGVTTTLVRPREGGD